MTSLRSMAVIFGAVLAFAFQTGLAQAEIKTRYVDYKQGDTQLSGHLAHDDSITGKRPGILLVHYRGGLSDTTLKDAEMIAKLGYVVFAEDIFGKGVLPKTVPEMTALTDIYNKDRPLMRTRSQAGFEVLRQNPMVDPTKLATNPSNASEERADREYKVAIQRFFKEIFGR